MGTTTTNDHPPRSWLIGLLRMSVAPLFLALLASVVMMAASFSVHDSGTAQALWDGGFDLLVLTGLLFAAMLWGGVYLQVVEASRGMPGLRQVDAPTMTAELIAELQGLQRSLTGLGFQHDEWFSLDDFDQTHVSAWRHDTHPAAAYILYSPTGHTFRLRIIRRFSSGGILVSSTRVVDLSNQPPQGMYVQVRKQASVEELWAWHLDGEALFPDTTGQVPPSNNAGGARGLYVEAYSRWAGHLRRDRTWLLAVEPVGECWRMYHLCGMPLRRQFELGWTTPFWQ